jgi:DNA-binding beta-propeller fold protein YncE
MRHQRSTVVFCCCALLVVALFFADASSPGEGTPASPQWVNLFVRDGAVGLLWVKNPKAASVRILRRGDAQGEKFVAIGETAGNVFADESAEGGRAYYYRLVAVDASGKESSPSKTRRIVSKKAVPQKTSAPLWDGYVFVEQGVGLKWSSPPEEKVLVYNIYRREKKNENYVLLNSVSRTSYRDTKVVPGREYFYVLTALGLDFSESPYSSELSLLYSRALEKKKTREISWKARKSRLLAMVEGEKAGFLWPADVAAVPGSGTVYLSDSGRNLVYLFTEKGRLVKTIGAAGDNAPGLFERLLGLAVGKEGQLYAVDPGHGYVYVMDQEGSLMGTHKLPLPKEGKTGFVDTTPGPAGRIYAVDNFNSSIAVLEENRLVETFGGAGFLEGELSSPTFCARDGEGRLLVSDTMNGRVQVFDASGNFVRSFGTNGQGLGKFARPKGIAVDEEGWIYVADSWQNLIQVFDGEGRFEAVLTDESGELLDLGSPNGIAVDGNRIYIAERLSRRLQIRELLDEQ